MESRTYQSDESDEELLIGIPDAIVFSRQADLSSPELPSIDETVVATQPRPETVSVPMPLEIKERYLEVREMGTDAVVTLIELLSPKNKRSG